MSVWLIESRPKHSTEEFVVNLSHQPFDRKMYADEWVEQIQSHINEYRAVEYVRKEGV